MAAQRKLRVISHVSGTSRDSENAINDFCQPKSGKSPTVKRTSDDVQSDLNGIQFQVWNSLDLRFEITAQETSRLRILSKVIQPSGVMADLIANLSKSHK